MKFNDYNYATSIDKLVETKFPLKHIPDTQNALVLRTDFSDESVWELICAAIQEPVGDLQAYVEFLSDPAYSGFTPEQLMLLVPQESDHTFLFIVDLFSLSHREHPILVIDLLDEPGRSFRVIPSEMWSVENNLSIANMDFHEFANSVDLDNIFRGFPD
jgi:hypothetical protein